jgi:HSP20 family protein
MARDFIHLIQAVFLPTRAEERDSDWQPPIDIYQTRDGWLLKVDLAGVRPEDVALILDGCHLTLRGLRRDWCLEEGCCHYRMEIAYSHFERTVELPDDLTRASVATEFRDGMLLVRIRKGQ